MRVGLVWAGGFRPNQPELWAVNERRNIPLRQLAELKHPEVEYYSLQKGEPAEGELAQLKAQNWSGPTLIDHVSELHDFEETAALVEQLDLVISVDTSAAHLAGALGKPVWLLNRFDTCWRWLLDRSDSPWYPTLRLYRQERPGDWRGVVQRIRQDLVEVVRRGTG
jgi:ADP-heptose:LPS heptosyltransferase